MLQINSQSIFDSPAQVLVCPVNCLGVMGAGLALEFKSRFPDPSNDYVKNCKNRWLSPGDLLFSRVSCDHDPRYICFFATKNHWKHDSKLIWIAKGLMSIEKHMNFYDLSTISIPKVGCGLGNLNWPVVKQMITECFEHHATIEVTIHEVD